jgi:hypothetical protein
MTQHLAVEPDQRLRDLIQDLDLPGAGLPSWSVASGQLRPRSGHHLLGHLSTGDGPSGMVHRRGMDAKDRLRRRPTPSLDEP